MIDIQIARERPEWLQQKCDDKRVKVRIPELLELDQRRLTVLKEVEVLRQKRNEISSRMKGSRPSDQDIADGKIVKEQLTEAESTFREIDGLWVSLLSRIPNMPADDVPIGGEEDSVEIRVSGSTDGEARDHVEYATERGWLDFDRGAKVSGAKFYFLKGDLALLELAVVRFAIDYVRRQGFELLTVPHLINSRTAAGAGFAPRGDDEGNEYFIEGEDLTLIGTAEAPLTAFHADEVFEEHELPRLYVGYSPCYRREAGTYGKHSRGLFRVHQFNKLEMYAFTLPEQSEKMHEHILSIEEAIWNALEIPYHVINIASGDLGAPAAKKYDIEYWSSVDKKYRELTSCSNCTDFQARNLNIRVKRPSGAIEFVHTLNGTAVSMARTLIAVIEHYQKSNGTLAIPTALQTYMDGRTEI
jgi:seryl-tRNA synthetase